MKKTYLVLMMMLLSTATVFAQAQVGLRAGASWATYIHDWDVPSGVDEPWRPGVIFGLASSFHMSPNFAIAPEVNFSQRGYKWEGNNAGLINSDVRTNYLEIPVLFRLSFGEILKGYVNAGPAFSYWLGGKGDVEDINFSEIDDAKRWEIGASLGGGVQLDTEAGSFLIDLRYTRGFNELRYDNDDFKNQLISTSLILLFPTIR